MSSMQAITSALFYLRVMTVVGMVRSRLRRLKQPKYLAGAAVGIAYFYFVLFRRFTEPIPGVGRSGAGAPLGCPVLLCSGGIRYG